MREGLFLIVRKSSTFPYHGEFLRDYLSGGGGVHVGFRMWGRGKTLESGGGGVYELGRCKWARM